MLPIVRFIARVFLTIPLRTSNFPVDVRHQLVNVSSLQTFKSSLLSVYLDVKVVVYTTRPVGKYGECKHIWSIYLCSILYEWLFRYVKTYMVVVYKSDSWIIFRYTIIMFQSDVMEIPTWITSHANLCNYIYVMAARKMMFVRWYIDVKVMYWCIQMW